MDAAGPAALVLDELHHAPSTSVALLAKVIDEAGADLRFLVGTRWDPVFPVGRWQAQGRLQQLRGPDLAFDLDETRQLLDLSERLGTRVRSSVRGSGLVGSACRCRS
jgi:ATP/maltotriose-dependent transcriptional regulator MalT